MRADELYVAWAPDESPWSVWAKPVLFAEMPALEVEPSIAVDGFPAIETPVHADGGTAVVVDLPGRASVLTGLALAQKGFRPVPLFNGCAALGMVVDVTGVIHALRSGADLLQGMRLAHDAPPAFLLDADRLGHSGTVAPGRFDNRWALVAQDMPSGSRLKQAAVRNVLLMSERVRDDLAHVLLRYQDAGLELTGAIPTSKEIWPVKPVKPAWYRSVFYALMVVAGLRRNAAGGFGAIVPEPSASGG